MYITILQYHNTWKVGHNKTYAQCALFEHILGHKVGHISNLILWHTRKLEYVQGWLLTCFVFPIIYNLNYWTQHGEITYHDFTENSWKFMKYSKKLGKIKHVP